MIISQVTFTPDITLGLVLQTIIFMITILTVYGKIITRLNQIEFKVNMMWGPFSKRILGRDVSREDDPASIVKE